MTLEQTFYLSQSIASVAVIASLIYLAMQVRYAERSQRGMMQQGRANRVSQAALTVASPELARVWQKGMAGDADLTREECTQWMNICRSLFLSGEDSFLQYKAGLLAPAAFDSYVAGVHQFMASSGLRAAWKLSAGQFGGEFRNFVTGMLEKTSAKRTDAYADWKKVVQAESGTMQSQP
jgi:hypothetical protein